MHVFTLLKKQFPPNEPWFSGLAVRLDSGFQGFDKTYTSSKLFLPTKKPRGENLIKNSKFRSTQQARKLVVVEYSLAA